MTAPGSESAHVHAPFPWDVADRYFSGEATPEEAEAIRQWVAADPSRAGELEALRHLWLEAGAPQPSGFDADAGWRALRLRMREVTSLDRALDRAPSAGSARPPLRLVGVGRKRPVWWWPASLSAAAAILVVGSIALMRHLAGSPDAAAAGQVQEYVTGVGQRTNVMLADGSRAWLGVGSRLRVGGGYGVRHRELHLEGEGYFDVASDPRRPFIVHANGVVAEALGTQFVVRRHADDTAATVVVVEGSVAVRTDSGGAPRRGVAITAGQLAEVDDAGLIKLTSDVDVQRYVGWREGRLEFHGAPLSEVSRELARWYGVDLVIEDSALLAVPVTGTFTDMPAATVIPIVCRSLNVHCDSDGRRVRIRE